MNENEFPASCAGLGFDSDIEGIGVVIAFTAGATFTISLVIYGYLAGELPKIKHTETDTILRNLFRPQRNNNSPVLNFAAEQASKRRRAKYLGDTLEALADQSLITGLAIIIGVYSKWDTLSFFSLQMVQVMVITSLILHLTTLLYCPYYTLQQHKPSVIRGAAILLIIIGSSSLQIIGLLIQCEDTFKSNIWNMRAACLLIHRRCTPSVSDALARVFGILAIPIYYFNIRTKHQRTQGPLHSSGYLYRGIVQMLGEQPGSFDQFESLYDIRLKTRLVEKWLKPLAILEAAYLAIKASISADIPWLLFGLIYCLFQIYIVWLDEKSPFMNYSESKALGFGQVTALILLLQPFLRAVDLLLVGHMDNREVEESPTRPQSVAATTYATLDQNIYRERGRTREILQEGGFRRALVGMYIWKICILLYAAIVFGGPWDVPALNYSAVFCICSLIAWSSLLEFIHLSSILCSKIFV